MALFEYVCPECGIEFKSKMRFESHIRANSEEIFLLTFKKVKENEKSQGRFPTGEVTIDSEIETALNKFQELRRIKGGYKKDKKQEPKKSDHKNVKKEKKK